MNLSFEDLLSHLIHQKRFYAAIANGMQKIATTDPNCPRMAVGIQHGRVVLYYNTDYLKKTFFANAEVSLNHEMIHVVFDHIPRFFEHLSRAPAEDRDRLNWAFNIAVDCADNCIVRKEVELWKKVAHVLRWTPEVASEKFDLQLEPDQAVEYYLERLRPKYDPALVPLCVESEDGSHKFWVLVEGGDGKEGDPGKLSTEELQGIAHVVRAQMKQLLRHVKQDFEKGRGTMPAGVKEWLTEYLADPVVPWWDVLESQVATKRQTKPRRSVQRPNRMLQAMAEEDRRILPAVGRLVDARFRVFYFEDHSGSMAVPERTILRSEFQSLLNADEDLEIRLMMGDASTHYDKLFKSGDEITWESNGGGGTDFNAYFEYMWQYVGSDDTAPDFVIVGTDAQCPPVDVRLHLPPEIPVIWLLTAAANDYWVNQIRQAGYGDILIADPAHRPRWKEK